MNNQSKADDLNLNNVTKYNKISQNQRFELLSLVLFKKFTIKKVLFTFIDQFLLKQYFLGKKQMQQTSQIQTILQLKPFYMLIGSAKDLTISLIIRSRC
ncbi:hypothetical protein ABPG72_013202 [Tetrahymena utriculariae]